MATEAATPLAPAHGYVRWAGWIAGLAAAVTLLALLTVAIDSDTIPSQDLTVMDEILGWDAPGLEDFFELVSAVTANNWPAILVGGFGVFFLWLLGQNREALAILAVGAVVVVVAFLGDYTLGNIVDRARPLTDGPINTHPSYPSGHTFGTTVFFGFWGYLAVYYRVPPKLLVPFLGLLIAFIAAVGLSRIHVGAHWPSDVAAGYLLGAIWLMILIPVFTRLRKVQFVLRRRLVQNPAVIACESCRVERSIASRVDLNPETGTATKVYRPPPVVSLLYWIAFQARFPYTRNEAALKAAAHRRKIASFLTIHRFGKDMVAPVVTVDCSHDFCSFVTDYIPGDLAQNTEEVREFLGQVAETFSAAGLSVWQVQPSNPHAHSNLIRSPNGEYTIIDLESAVVTLLPGPGQWRSALRKGLVPVFDDIDFDRLRGYIAEHRESLLESIGPDGIKEFENEVVFGELAIEAWKASEPRIPGRVISRLYRTFDLKSYAQHLMGAIKGADVAAQVFLGRGIERWLAEGRITPDKAVELQDRASAPGARTAMYHMGVHLVLSVAVAVPLPGARSLARALWTSFYWVRTRLRRGRDGELGQNVHGPVVIVLSLVPLLGGVAYLASRPLRSRQLVRLILDQAAIKAPLRLYERLRLGRWLAPAAAAPGGDGP